LTRPLLAALGAGLTHYVVKEVSCFSHGERLPLRTICRSSLTRLRIESGADSACQRPAKWAKNDEKPTFKAAVDEEYARFFSEYKRDIGVDVLWHTTKKVRAIHRLEVLSIMCSAR
jgi:hypothetical protein